MLVLIEFGIGLQAEFGLPPVIGRRYVSGKTSEYCLPSQSSPFDKAFAIGLTAIEIAGGEPTLSSCERFDLVYGYPKVTEVGKITPRFMYFAHSDLVGNSMNLRRVTSLVDFPEGSVYDSRQEYMYVHSVSPFPTIKFVQFVPIVHDDTVEYDIVPFTPLNFYIIITYYEADN